jgi:DNA polymerase-3 subunit gamma/tau
MDAASESGVEDIRQQIVEAVEYRPMICRYKIFIIDEVHDLSSKAFDALLKTIEEPPPHIVFILATTEYNKVPPTIRSRCQKHEFRRASLQDLVGRLEYVLKGEHFEAEPAAVAAIARMADGGYRDALTLLEQAMLVSDGKIGLEQVYDQLGLVAEDTIDGIFQSIRKQDVPDLIERLESITRLGRDPRAILESMMYRLSDLTRASYNVKDRNLDPARDADLHQTAVTLGRDLILRLRSDVAEAHKVIRDISLPRLWLESRLVSLAAGAAMRPIAAEPDVAAISPRPVAASRQSAPPLEKEPVPITSSSLPELSGDPSLDEAIQAWYQSKIKLGEMSPTMKMRLETSTVTARDGHSVTLQLERHSDLDWIQEGNKRAPGILRVFREMLNGEADLRYVVKRKGSSVEEAKPVELPLEGQRLEEFVKQIFT